MAGRNTDNDDEILQEVRIKVAVLDHRLSQVEASVAELQNDKASFLSTTNKITGAVVVLSTIGSAVAGYIYDKFLK